MSLATSELCGTSYLLQKLSVAVQLGMPQPLWVVPIHPWIFNNFKWLLLLLLLLLLSLIIVTNVSFLNKVKSLFDIVFSD